MYLNNLGAPVSDQAPQRSQIPAQRRSKAALRHRVRRCAEPPQGDRNNFDPGLLQAPARFIGVGGKRHQRLDPAVAERVSETQGLVVGTTECRPVDYRKKTHGLEGQTMGGDSWGRGAVRRADVN